MRFSAWNQEESNLGVGGTPGSELWGSHASSSVSSISLLPCVVKALESFLVSNFLLSTFSLTLSSWLWPYHSVVATLVQLFSGPHAHLLPTCSSSLLGSCGTQLFALPCDSSGPSLWPGFFPLLGIFSPSWLHVPPLMVLSSSAAFSLTVGFFFFSF